MDCSDCWQAIQKLGRLPNSFEHMAHDNSASLQTSRHFSRLTWSTPSNILSRTWGTWTSNRLWNECILQLPQAPLLPKSKRLQTLPPWALSKSLNQCNQNGSNLVVAMRFTMRCVQRQRAHSLSQCHMPFIRRRAVRVRQQRQAIFFTLSFERRRKKEKNLASFGALLRYGRGRARGSCVSSGE